MRYPVLEIFGGMYHKITENNMETPLPTWRPDTIGSSGTYFGFVKTFRLSVEPANIHIDTSLNTLVDQTSKTQWIDVHVRARDMFLSWNSNCSIFKTKCATDMKTCKPVYFWKCILADKDNLKFCLLFNCSCLWRHVKTKNWF